MCRLTSPSSSRSRTAQSSFYVSVPGEYPDAVERLAASLGVFPQPVGDPLGELARLGSAQSGGVEVGPIEVDGGQGQELVTQGRDRLGLGDTAVGTGQLEGAGSARGAMSG